MARESNQNEQIGRRSDPAQDDVDPNQISREAGAGSSGVMYDGLSEAQTAGSRNDRATEYEGVKRSVEPTTASEYPTGVPVSKVSDDAPGISNRTLGEERSGQEKVVHGREEVIVADDADGLPKDADKAIEGGLPGAKKRR